MARQVVESVQLSVRLINKSTAFINGKPEWAPPIADMILLCGEALLDAFATHETRTGLTLEANS